MRRCDLLEQNANTWDALIPEFEKRKYIAYVYFSGFLILSKCYTANNLRIPRDISGVSTGLINPVLQKDRFKDGVRLTHPYSSCHAVVVAQ